MTQITDVFGEIWKRMNGAGKEIIKRFSNKVIQPMALHLNERSQRSFNLSLPRCLPTKKFELRLPTFRPATKMLLARRYRNNKNGLCINQRMKPTPHRVQTFADTTTAVSTTDAATEKSELSFTTVPAPRSDVICNTCACAENYVYCNNMNIHEPFKLEDWEGLSNFTPLTVDLSQNPLSSITRMGKLPIQVLNLSNCYINKFEPAALTYLEDINTLDLSHNKISATDLLDLCGPLEEFAETRPFKEMLDLSLAHNAIYSLPEAMFTFMKNLSFLDVSGNPLAVIDDGTMTALSMLGELKHLLLKDCELEILPMRLFKNQKKLRWLDLSDNRFTTVPPALQDLFKLSFLSLEGNPIATVDIESSITKLVNLEELNLSHMNNLQNITAGAMGGLTKLGILRLNHNPRLSKLDPSFLVSPGADQIPLWPKLRELHLNNNNLTTINVDFLEYWEDLEAGDFSNNPYVCDCENQWMVDVLTPLVQNLPQSQTVYQMVCNEPADLRGISFGYMSNISKTLSCEANSSQKLSSLMVTLGTLTGVLAIIPLVIFFIIMIRKQAKKLKKSVLRNVPRNLNELL